MCGGILPRKNTQIKNEIGTTTIINQIRNYPTINGGVDEGIFINNDSSIES